MRRRFAFQKALSDTVTSPSALHDNPVKRATQVTAPPFDKEGISPKSRNKKQGKSGAETQILTLVLSLLPHCSSLPPPPQRCHKVPPQFEPRPVFHTSLPRPPTAAQRPRLCFHTAHSPSAPSLSNPLRPQTTPAHETPPVTGSSTRPPSRPPADPRPAPPPPLAPQSPSVSLRPGRPRLPSPRMQVSARPGSGPMTGPC